MPRNPSNRVILREPTRLTWGPVTLLVVGFYEVGEEEGPLIVEGILSAPGHFADDADFLRFYTPPNWDQDPTPITRLFFLDPLGETLVGNYLHPVERLSPTAWADRMKPIRVRFVALLPPGAEGLLTHFGTVKAAETEPIPERLLRLIWLED